MDGKSVFLPRIGRVEMMECLRFGGSIREVTINRTAGTWFASFCLEDGQPVPPVKDGPTVGVDAGGVLQRPEGRKSQGAERSAQTVAPGGQGHCQVQDRARKSSRSNRRERLYAKRRKVHARIVQVRNDNHHKATTAIAKCAGRVVVETLNVAGMLHNRRLARSIADAGMAGFLAKLEYKCVWYGAEFAKADRWFPS